MLSRSSQGYGATAFPSGEQGFISKNWKWIVVAGVFLAVVVWVGTGKRHKSLNDTTNRRLAQKGVEVIIREGRPEFVSKEQSEETIGTETAESVAEKEARAISTDTESASPTEEAEPEPVPVLRRKTSPNEPEDRSRRGEHAPIDAKGRLIPLKPGKLRAPVMETIDHPAGTTEVAWHLADLGKEQGIVLLFHGCGGSSSLWFELPEHRANVKSLVHGGFSVIAFTSHDRSSKCWDETWPLEYAKGTRVNPDVVSVLGALKFWLNREDKEQMPLFAFGASSGGTFASLISRALYLHGSVVMISPGHDIALTSLPAHEPTPYRRRYAAAVPPVLDPTLLDDASTLFNLPPIAFIFMDRDKDWASTSAITYHRGIILANNPWLDGTAIGMHERLPLWDVEPTKWTPESLLQIDAVAESPVGKDCSFAFYLAAREPSASLSHLNDVAKSEASADGAPPALLERKFSDSLLDPQTDLLALNPRRVMGQRIVRDILDEVEADAKQFKGDQHVFTTATDKSAAWSACLALIDANQRAVDELLNVHYASHEMTSEYADQTVAWFAALIQDETDPRLKEIEDAHSTE